MHYPALARQCFANCHQRCQQRTIRSVLRPQKTIGQPMRQWSQEMMHQHSHSQKTIGQSMRQWSEMHRWPEMHQHQQKAIGQSMRRWPEMRQWSQEMLRQRLRRL